MENRPSGVNANRVIVGATFVVWGLLLTLDQTGIVHIRHVGALWPLIIIAFGVGKLVGSDTHRGRRPGIWLLVIGLWFALNEFGVFRYHDTWPLLLVAAGAIMIWDVIAGGGAGRPAAEDEHGR